METGTSSFRELFGDGHRVEIPVIQRDYAQGHEDEHSTEVRRRFLDAVGAALSAVIHEGDALDLDFVKSLTPARAAAYAAAFITLLDAIARLWK